MDPNRHKLETILKLPTHRLLNYYRGERNSLSSLFYYDDFLGDCYCDLREQVSIHDEYVPHTRLWNVQQAKIRFMNLNLIKSELDKREHLN